MGMRTRSITIAALALGLVPGAAHAFTWEGRCEQVGAVVSADAAAVREHLPAGWPVHETAGKVTLFLTGGDCRDQRLNGRSVGDSHFGLVSVPSAAHPDTGQPGAGYDIWWFNSDPTIANAMQRAGFDVPYVRDLRSSTETGPLGATRGRLSVPWPDSPFTVHVTGSATSPPSPHSFTSSHWHSGRLGRVLFEPEHFAFDSTGGTAAVRVAPGTPIARMLGGTEASGPGVFFSFSFAGGAGPA